MAIDDIDMFAARDREPPSELGLMTPWDAVKDLRKMQGLPRYPTPWPSVTAAIGLDGWYAGQLYTLVGGTGVGKTTFAIAVAKHFAENHGHVIYVSDEMRTGHCLTRAASGALGVSSNDIVRAHHAYTDEQLASTLPPRFWFMRRRPLAKIKEAGLWFKQTYGYGPLFVIDYFGKVVNQVLKSMEKPDPRRATSIVSDELLMIAEDLDSPIFALSAGGRGSTSKLRGNRGNRRMDVRDISPAELVDTAKESSDVEYDAAALLTISVSDERDIDGLQIATVTVAKARFGRAQHIAFAYDGPNGIWYDRGRVERAPDVKPGAAVDAMNAEMSTLRAEVMGILAHGPTSQRAIAERIRKAGGKARMETIGQAVNQLVKTGDAERIGNGRNARVQLASPPLPGMGARADA